MRVFLIVFLLFSFAASGQKVYLSHEVEKQVEPTGGLSFLNQFINANLQLPFQSSMKGVNGRVYVKGIVEPDGSMTNMEVAKGIDSLCNKEAIRLLGLYKAWQPAVLKGEKVRQYFVYPIVFKAEPKSNFDSASFTITDYFDKNFNYTTNPKDYEYRVLRTVDNQGYINGDVVSEEKKGKKWTNLGRIPFKRDEVWFKTAYDGSRRDSVRAYELSARDENLASYASEAIFQLNGKLLAYKEYTGENKISRSSEYDLKGLLRKLNVYKDSSYTELLWHDNGQLESVVERPFTKNFVSKEPVYHNLWERDGTQKVKDGDGIWHSKYVDYIEEGKLVGGKKDGKWVAKLDNGKVQYEELYDVGQLLEGTSYEDGVERTYNQAVIEPYFKMGSNNFYKFLGQNIRYPIVASQRKISGRVQLSFVVCEDGSLCDYKVEKGMGFGLDHEALRVVKKMDGMWEPGVLRGKKVRVKYNLPINFQVE